MPQVGKRSLHILKLARKKLKHTQKRKRKKLDPDINGEETLDTKSQ